MIQEAAGRTAEEQDSGGSAPPSWLRLLAFAAAAGVLLLGLFLVNSLSRVFDSLSTWRWLSPFRYYDLSQPLPPGGHFEVRALLVLVGVSVVKAG